MAENYADRIREFLDYLKFEKRYSEHTIISYENDISSFFSFMEQSFDAPPIGEINHTLIRSWLAGLKEEKLASRSINRKISTLRSFFKYHLKRGNIDAVPTASLVTAKVSRRLPVFVKEQDTQQLLKTLDTSTEDWKSLNARMLISIFYATGMRLSELINLKEKQLDQSRLQLRVLGKGNKERIIPVSRELFDDINEYQRLKKKTFENA